MADKKYELTDITYECDGNKYHRIRALKSFGSSDGVHINAGDLGGFVESEGNLSQDGNCWVFGPAAERGLNFTDIWEQSGRVYGNAVVKDDAVVDCHSCVSGNAVVKNYASVGHHSDISGNIVISDYAYVKNCYISDDVRVYDTAYVNHAHLAGTTEVYGQAKIDGHFSEVDDNDYFRSSFNNVSNNVLKCSNFSGFFDDSFYASENNRLFLTGNTKVHDNVEIKCISTDDCIKIHDSDIHDNVLIEHNAYIVDCNVFDNSHICSENKEGYPKLVGLNIGQDAYIDRYYKHDDLLSINGVSEKNFKHNVYLNRVSEKLIHDTKQLGVKVILIPDTESKSGYGNVFVNEKQIFQTTKKNGEPVPGMMNVNLGLFERNIKYSIKTDDDSYQNKMIMAAEVADKWKMSRSNYYTKSAIDVEPVKDISAEKDTEFGE